MPNVVNCRAIICGGLNQKLSGNLGSYIDNINAVTTIQINCQVVEDVKQLNSTRPSNKTACFIFKSGCSVLVAKHLKQD